MAVSGVNFIFGLHSVRHTLEESPQTVRELFVQKGRKRNAELDKILHEAEFAGVSVQWVSRAALDRKSANARHQGILAVLTTAANAAFPVLNEIIDKSDRDALYLVLDGIQDPHNLGACLRTANAAGVDAVIIPRDNSAPLNATVSKVASGAAEHTAVHPVPNIARSLRQLQQAGVWVIGTDADAVKSIYEVDYSGPVALVMGSEGRGMRQNTRKHCDDLVFLPMHGKVESLNVSVATGICLYEVLRQRGANLGQ